jgi:chromate reductase
MLGSARAQYDLRRCCVYLNAFVLNQPEVMIAKVHERFDKHGKLTHQGSQRLVAEQLDALVAFVERVRPQRISA